MSEWLQLTLDEAATAARLAPRIGSSLRNAGVAEPERLAEHIAAAVAGVMSQAVREAVAEVARSILDAELTVEPEAIGGMVVEIRQNIAEMDVRDVSEIPEKMAPMVIEAAGLIAAGAMGDFAAGILEALGLPLEITDA